MWLLAPVCLLSMLEADDGQLTWLAYKHNHRFEDSGGHTEEFKHIDWIKEY